jgi:hypothetical protein
MNCTSSKLGTLLFKKCSKEKEMKAKGPQNIFAGYISDENFASRIKKGPHNSIIRTQTIQ